MDNNKIKVISNLFEGKEIRSVWDSEKEEYYFSVVDIVGALTDSNEPRKYWSVLKNRLKKEGSEVTTKCSQLKMLAPDGKMRLRDVLDTQGILRLIESIPSPKAEPFKLWLAQMGKERIDEVFDPEIAMSRAIDYYRNRGYSDKWIEARLKGILDRKKLTDVWKENGIKHNYEYGILTNEIYKEWSGMKASEYKEYKNIRKESLRDNMTDVEVALANLGEIATRELTKKHKPYGLKQNKLIAKKGGHVAKVAKEDMEKELGETIISKENVLNYEYINEKKFLQNRFIMYDYVLQYGFDEHTKEAIQKIKNCLKKNNVKDKERNWLPHITIDLYNCNNYNEFIKKLDNLVKKINVLEIECKNLNNFKEETLYIEPYNKEKLMKLKLIFDKELLKYRLEERKKREYKPHITLCTNDDLTKAKEIAKQEFKPFVAKIKYLWVYNFDMKLIKEYELKS